MRHHSRTIDGVEKSITEVLTNKEHFLDHNQRERERETKLRAELATQAGDLDDLVHAVETSEVE